MFGNKTLYDQILSLQGLLQLFTSPDTSIVKKHLDEFKKATLNFKPSVNLSGDITLVYDSFSGLYSREVTYKLKNAIPRC